MSCHKCYRFGTTTVQSFWDDEDAPQSPKPIQIYREEEVQELVDNAYNKGWQEKMEEGYKLGKDRGNKEDKKEKQANGTQTHSPKMSKTTPRYPRQLTILLRRRYQ